MIHGFHNDREPVIRHVDQGTSRDAPAIGPWVSERFDGCPVGAAGAADPASQDGRTAAPDRHARGDERDLLSAAHGLPLAVFAGRSLSAALDGLQYFPQVPAGRRVGTDVGGVARGLARTVGSRGQPECGHHRQPVAEGGGKRGCKSRCENDAVGYDAGKKVKGRKLHALVDVEGLPLRVVVHSAGLQDRDGAGVVLHKIRQRFPWLELVWADSGYNARQVTDALAKIPSLRIEIVKRSDDRKGFVVSPRRWVVERTFSWFGRNRRLAKDYENLADTLAAFVTLAAIHLAIRRTART